MPADIIVRIGAAQDSSVDAVFSNIEKRGKRAFETTRRESNRNTQEARSDGQKAIAISQLTAQQQIALAKWRAAQELKVERDRYRENSRLNRQIATEQAKTERAMALHSAKISRERTKERLQAIATEERAEAAYQQRLLRMKIRGQTDANRAQRAAERERNREAYRNEREIDRFATRTSHRATRFFFPRPEGAIGYGRRIAGDLARGAGVDTSFGGGVARARERETAGMGLAQQERIATGQSRGGAFWAGKSLEIGTDLKLDPEKVTELMRAFTGKTGDFDAASSSAKELASMTLASGANMGEMGSAAGYVYNQLKGMPDAAERTLDVMRGIVGQTAVGAVEMEEYAKQMGRVAANAKMFQGDVSKNILELSALTQLSIAEGGATSGADAARSIAAFANTTSKGQRINAFAKHGINLFNESGTQKRPILDIIKDSLIQSKGSIPEMTKMWADTLGQKPIRGITNAFNAAGGGEKGWQAAMAKVKPFMDAQLSRETERKNVADYNATIAAKAQDFQNKLDQITTSLAGKLLPAFEQLSPKLLQLTNAFSDAIAWAAGNPWQAVMALLGASVARAATESFGRLLLERGINGLVGGAAGNAAGGSVGSAVGGLLGKGATAVGGALTGGMGAPANTAGVLAVAAASFMITDAIINSANTTVNESKERQARSANDTFQQFASEYSGAKTDSERAEIMKRAKSNLEQDEGSRGLVDRLFGNSDVFLSAMKGLEDFARQQDEARARATPSVDAAAIGGPAGARVSENNIATALAGALAGKTMNVRMVNTDDIKFPSNESQGGSGPATFSQGP